MQTGRAKHNSSRQRDAVLHELSCRCDHPTAEQLYLSLKPGYPSLSLATVYRNLNVLEQQGAVVRIAGVHADRFDADTSAHSHFTCTACHGVMDLEVSESGVNGLVSGFKGKIESHSLMYYGLCPSCLNNESQAKSARISDA